jgi:hypothetical protein
MENEAAAMFDQGCRHADGLPMNIGYMMERGTKNAEAPFSGKRTLPGGTGIFPIRLPISGETGKGTVVICGLKLYFKE